MGRQSHVGCLAVDRPCACVTERAQLRGVQLWVGDYNAAVIQSIFFRGCFDVAGVGDLEDISPIEFARLVSRCGRVWRPRHPHAVIFQ